MELIHKTLSELLVSIGQLLLIVRPHSHGQVGFFFFTTIIVVDTTSILISENGLRMTIKSLFTHPTNRKLFFMLVYKEKQILLPISISTPLYVSQSVY